MAKETVTAAELFQKTTLDRKWVVAARGRWQSGDTLCEAIRILGEKPEAGIMQVSEDFTVDPMFGGVNAAHVTSFELEPEEMDRLMAKVVQDILLDMQDQMTFVMEYLDTTEADEALDNLASKAEELAE